MARNPSIDRRDFLTGTLRGRDQAQRKLGEHHGFGPKEEARIEGDPTASERAWELPGWEPNIDHVLKEMNDLKGIEDP